MAQPLLARIKSWLLGRNSGPVFLFQETCAAASWDLECQAAIDEIASGALESGEVITATSLLRGLCAHLPLERAYGAEEAERFLRTLDAQLETPRMQVAPEHEALSDHDVAMIVAVLAHNSREEDGAITVARLAGAALGRPALTGKLLARAGFDTMPLLRWATHKTLEVRDHWPTGDFDDDPEALFELLIINDSITTQDVVIRLLTKHLSVSLEAAHTMMLETHNDGESLLAVSELEIVVAMAEAIEADARAEGFPLGLTIRPSV